MNSFSFTTPNKVKVGDSESKKLFKILRKLNLSKLLLVVDKHLKEMGLISDILYNLKKENVNFEVYDEIRNEPTIEEIDNAINTLKVEERFEGVVGIGGGSTLDVAKLLAVSSAIKGSVKKYIKDKNITQNGLTTIMIPTTSGTGSEATPNAIVKDKEENCKRGIVSMNLIPNLVILDPELTLSLPPKITAETGIDAFTHAIECYIGKKSTPMSNMYALESMTLISSYLHTAIKDGSNKEARYYMLLGSFYGGVAITNSGTGAVHALAYPLGGEYGVSHGLSNAILLSEVMKFNAKYIPDKFIKVAKTMGLKKDKYSQKELVEITLEKIDKLVNKAGISPKNIEVTTKDLDSLSKSAMTVERLLKNNPAPIDYTKAKEIYRKSLNL